MSRASPRCGGRRAGEVAQARPAARALDPGALRRGRRAEHRVQLPALRRAGARALDYRLALTICSVVTIVWNFNTTGRLVFGNRRQALIFKFVGGYGVIYLVNLGLVIMLARFGVGELARQALALPVVVALFFRAESGLGLPGPPSPAVQAPGPARGADVTAARPWRIIKCEIDPRDSAVVWCSGAERLARKEQSMAKSKSLVFMSVYLVLAAVCRPARRSPCRSRT